MFTTHVLDEWKLEIAHEVIREARFRLYPTPFAFIPEVARGSARVPGV